MKRSFAIAVCLPPISALLLIPADDAFAQSHGPHTWSVNGHATVTIRNGFALRVGVMPGQSKAVADGHKDKPRLRHMDNEGHVLSGPAIGSQAIMIVDLP